MTVRSKKMWASAAFLPVLAVLVLLGAAFALPEKADAAAKYELLYVAENVYENEPIEKREAAGGWYWKRYVCADLSTSTLYYSKTEEGTGRKLVRLKLGEEYGSNYMNSEILTNGTKVYYATEYWDPWTKHKARIYSVGTNGKNKKLVKTLTMQPGETVNLVHVYNDRLYFEKHKDEGKCKLYCLTLGKTQKLTKVSANFDFCIGTGIEPGARYLYGRSWNDRSIKVFDCRTNKIIRTIAGYVSGFKAEQGKVYYTVYDEAFRTKVYQASLSGAGRTLLLTLPSDASVDSFDSTAVYYQQMVETETGAEQFHVYDLAAKTHRSISMEEYKFE